MGGNQIGGEVEIFPRLFADLPAQGEKFREHRRARLVHEAQHRVLRMFRRDLHRAGGVLQQQLL